MSSFSKRTCVSDAFLCLTTTPPPKKNRKQNAESAVTASPLTSSLCAVSRLLLLKPHLLAQGAIAALSPPVELVRLAQQGVEGLSGAVDGGRVGGHGEGGDVAHLLQRAVAFGGLIEQLVVLQVLREPLEHGNGLIEVHLQVKRCSVGLSAELLFRLDSFNSEMLCTTRNLIVFEQQNDNNKKNCFHSSFAAQSHDARSKQSP